MIERIKNNFNNKKIFIFILLVLWCITVFVTLFNNRNTLGKESTGNLEYNYVEMIDSERFLSQIVEAKDGVNEIAVRFEVYQKSAKTVTIETVGVESNTIYGKSIVSLSDLETASFNVFVLDRPISAELDKTIRIRISTDADSGALGVWCTFENCFNNPLYATGEKLDGSMSLRLLFDSEMYQSFSNITIIALVTSISLMIVYILLFEPKKEVIYTLITFIIGLIFLVILTPLAGPDEEYHYRVSLVVSNKFLRVEDPNVIVDKYVGYYNAMPNLNIGEVYRTVIENFNIPLVDLNGRDMYELNRSYVYWYDLCYYPQAIGITIARLLKFNFFRTYYLGRLSSLLFYTGCIYFALKKTPVLKDLFGVIATLPICLQQAVTYSQDMWVIALSMALFACFLDWYFKEGKITKKDFIITLLIDLILAPAKIVYSLFVLPFWFVSKDKFYSNKHRYFVLLLLMAPTIYQIGYHTLSRIIIAITHPISAEEIGTNATHDVEEYFSLQYIAAHPLEAISITVRTIAANFKAWFAASVGRYLSGLSLIIPSGISYLMILNIVMSSLIKQKGQLSLSVKGILLLVCLMIFGLTLMAMLTGWTSTSSEYIDGIQGRYFTPLLVYLFACLNNKKIGIPDKYNYLIPYLQLIMLFEVVIYILSYTFVY